MDDVKKLIMDIGTKSIKAFVYEFRDGAAPVQIWRKKIDTMIGKFLVDGLLADEGINALISHIKIVLSDTEQFKPDMVTAFATEWIRLAKNQNDIVSRVKDETGIAIQVLSHQEELEAYWRGVTRDFNHDGMIAAIDIGGGSVQFFWGDKMGLKGSLCLKTGTFPMYKQFIQSEPHTDAEYEAIENYIRDQIKDIDVVLPPDTPFIHGSSSVIDFYTEAGIEMSPYDKSPSHPYQITIAEVEEFYKKHRTALQSEKGKLYPSDPDFTKGAFIGFAHVIVIAEKFGCTVDIPSNNSIVHGFL